jgi:hypothetical protein
MLKIKIILSFLRVFIEYPTPSGAAMALGKETMSGMLRRLGAKLQCKIWKK